MKPPGIKRCMPWPLIAIDVVCLQLEVLADGYVHTMSDAKSNPTDDSPAHSHREMNKINGQ